MKIWRQLRSRYEIILLLLVVSGAEQGILFGADSANPRGDKKSSRAKIHYFHLQKNSLSSAHRTSHRDELMHVTENSKHLCNFPGRFWLGSLCRCLQRNDPPTPPTRETSTSGAFPESPSPKSTDQMQNSTTLHVFHTRFF